MAETAISRDDYSRALHGAHATWLMARGVCAQGDVDAAIAAIDHADAVGPILDPTLHRDLADAMHEDREILAAVRDLARLGSPAGAPT